MTTAEYTLARLRREYPGWRIRRSRNGYRLAGWVATNLRDDDRAPTLHGDTAEELEQQLKDPPQRAGRPFPALRAHP
ncbi:hypothetical protein F4561_002689 [Lipingzhangella halophila]|uniref:Uncharacterized protein n=1 Tax=Lipingzhangella halophila TaxID=1783352 RepID=A0A7W7RH34_9ACTN|nr:hypothetical protein [Lipingzhangella halophila]MBB4931869.1 hypothetical protein [Lipingzhangella halophila]